MSDHKEMPGKGVLFFEPHEKRTSPKGPDYKGFVILEMDYKAGDKLKISAWEKKTNYGTLFSLAEDNWSRKQKETPRKVQSDSAQRSRPGWYGAEAKIVDLSENSEACLMHTPTAIAFRRWA